MQKLKPETKRRLRNIGLTLGALGAIGTGCYFGTKKGFNGLIVVAKKAEERLDHIAAEASTIVDMMQFENESKVVQRKVINVALDEGMDFQFYPGLGVKFPSMADVEKVDKILGR